MRYRYYGDKRVSNINSKLLLRLELENLTIRDDTTLRSFNIPEATFEVYLSTIPNKFPDLYIDLYPFGQTDYDLDKSCGRIILYSSLVCFSRFSIDYIYNIKVTYFDNNDTDVSLFDLLSNIGEYRKIEDNTVVLYYLPKNKLFQTNVENYTLQYKLVLPNGKDILYTYPE